MFTKRSKAQGSDAFQRVFGLCRVRPGEMAAILCKTRSRAVNAHLADLALARCGAVDVHVVVPAPP